MNSQTLLQFSCLRKAPEGVLGLAAELADCNQNTLSES